MRFARVPVMLDGLMFASGAGKSGGCLVISNKKSILQHLATPGFSLEREGPGKAHAAIPKQLTYTKPERIVPDAYVSTGLFLFWFVVSFCVFNLLHAFKSLALFPPFGENGRSLFRRDFGSALTSFAVLDLFHKNKPLITLRCRSLLFLLLRDYGCFAPFALHNSAPPYANSPPNKKKK